MCSIGPYRMAQFVKQFCGFFHEFDRSTACPMRGPSRTYAAELPVHCLATVCPMRGSSRTYAAELPVHCPALLRVLCESRQEHMRSKHRVDTVIES